MSIAATEARGALIELAFRLGVPTFILVLGMLLILPRIDRGLETVARVEVYMDIMTQRCAVAVPPV